MATDRRWTGGKGIASAGTALVATTVLAALLFALGSASAASSTLAPTSIVTVGGKTGAGQPVGNLAVQDQSGTQDDWSRYVEFQGHTAGAAYSGYLTLTLPGSVPPSTVTGIQVKVNYRGPGKATQAWTWRIKNWTTGAWVTLGDNAAAPDWGSWAMLTFAAAGAPSAYVQAGTGAIQVQLTSNNAADDTDIDYEALVVTSTTPSPTPTGTGPSPTPTGPMWTPAQNSRWQYQLTGNTSFASTGGINVNICQTPYGGGSCVKPTVFDIDLYVDQTVSGNNNTLDTAAVNAIHANGARAICYVDAGTWENWRPDAGQFPASVKGNQNGWPGELWLDIRQTSVLLPLMDARVAKCKQAGFDSVEFDNVDGYSNNTGFPLVSADQITFNKSLVGIAHKYGLSAGLKNDLDQVPALVSTFDYAVNEQCQQYAECAKLQPFLSAGKAVLQVEYSGSLSTICSAANAVNRGAIMKDLNLHDVPWTPCR